MWGFFFLCLFVVVVVLLLLLLLLFWVFHSIINIPLDEILLGKVLTTVPFIRKSSMEIVLVRSEGGSARAMQKESLKSSLADLVTVTNVTMG